MTAEKKLTAEVRIDGKKFPMNGFVKELFTSINMALLKTLKHTDNFDTVTITLKKTT